MLRSAFVLRQARLGLATRAAIHSSATVAQPLNSTRAPAPSTAPTHRRALATEVHAPVSTPSRAPEAPVEPGSLKPLLLEDMSAEEQKAARMFTMSRAKGFLPRAEPMTVLPSQFSTLESLLQRMTIHQPDGSRGLLATGDFGAAVLKELTQKDTDAVMEAINSKDQELISALFRDYCFATSAYLLEPVDLSFRRTGKYAPGRSVLPKHLAVPIKALADELGHYPYMEYASSYALINYRRVEGGDCAAGTLGDPKSYETDNLRLIRAFQDFDGSESGFITVHVSMVAYTGQLVSAVEDVLAAAECRDRGAFNSSLNDLNEVYGKINETMETMWSWSRPVDYLKFRSFIFGTGPKKMNAMFPEGVIYEGVSSEPMVFRGESGANDSIVPVGDNLLQITRNLPKNELADILREFRKYRPNAQAEYVDNLEHRATNARVAEFAHEDQDSLGRYICALDQIREIRSRHWKFTCQYIIKYTDTPIATGGSPILAYLPQNLTVVLDTIQAACAQLPETLSLEDRQLAALVETIRARAIAEKIALEEQVARLRAEVKGRDDKRIGVQREENGVEARY